MAIVTILMAIVTFYLQSRKLKWKVLAFKDSKMAYASIKEVLLNEDWIVNANKEKTMIQATRKNSLELLTLVIEKDKIKWNLIHHPYDRNAFLSLFASNKNGKRMIGRLKTAANNSDQLRPEISQL